jgi:hypothetical protein
LTTAKRRIAEADGRADRLRFRWPGRVRLLAAVVVAGLVTLALMVALPRHLKVSTDVVGYPIWADFNIEWLVDLYYLGVLFFPLLALAVYLAQTWLAARLGLTAAGEHRSTPVETAREPEVSTADRRVPAWAVVRALAVGASFALAATIVGGATADYFWITLAAVSAGYTALLFGIAWFMRRGDGAHQEMATSAAKVNAIAAPLAILGLWAATASITVTVASTGQVHHYPWLPWWVVVALTVAAAGWIWPRLLAAQTEPAIRAIEHKTILYVTAPLVLFLLMTWMQGDLNQIDVFHEGELLVAAKLTAGGALYWRDLLSAHGLFQDILMPLLGMRLLGDSRWGMLTANPVLWAPLTFVFFYFLGAWLFERSWAFVVALMVLLVSLQFVTLDPRFMFWPLILLLLGVALQSRKAWISAVVGVALTAQAILVPESAYCVPACGVIVILHDLYQRRRGATLMATFSKSIWMIGGGVALFAVFSLYLVSQHALGDFFFYYLIFVPGHELVGGLTIHLRANGPFFVFVELAPPIATVLGFGYFAAMVIRRQPLDARAWVIGASALFALLYYTKFIERADLGHGDQAYGEALPLILFLIYRACTWVDRALLRSDWFGSIGRIVGRQPVSVMLLVATLVLIVTPSEVHTGPQLLAWLAATPDRYHPTAANPPALPLVGYSENAIDPATVQDMQAVFNAYLQPGDWVFDFSNQPALVYYLLGQSPHTRYYHVTMALTERAQKDLISELKHDPPKLIVFTDETYGLLNWDGIPNMVRSYEVSQYILDNYTPLLSTHTQIIYGRTSDQLSPAAAQSLPLQQPVMTSDLAFGGFSCDWGYAPNFLFISPPAPTHQVTPVTLTTTADPNAIVTFEGWAGDPTTQATASQVVVTLGGKVVGQIAPNDVTAALERPGFVTSGYRLTVSVPDALLSDPNGMQSLRVFGVSSRGVASELIDSPGAAGPPVAQISLADGTTVPVRGGEVTGPVDIIIPFHQILISPPAGSAWADYRWLEIDTSSSFAKDVWAVYDGQTGEPGHQIIFRTLGGSSTVLRVYVGSCAQWHGYGAIPLFLSHSGAQDIGTVRLLP